MALPLGAAVLAARQIDAGVNGNMTLSLGAASDHTEVNKTTSPPAVERCHPSGGGMVYGGVV